MNWRNRSTLRCRATSLVRARWARNRLTTSGRLAVRTEINAARKDCQSRTVQRQISRTMPVCARGDVLGAEAERALADDPGGKRLGGFREPSGQFDAEQLRAYPAVDRLRAMARKLVE